MKRMSGSPVDYIELNLSNYDVDDVSQLNEWGIWAIARLDELQKQSDAMMRIVNNNVQQEAELITLRDEVARLKHSLEFYGKELDDIADHLQPLHPIGQIKAIGRFEAAQALREVIAILTPDHSRLQDRLSQLERVVEAAKEWFHHNPIDRLETISPFDDKLWKKLNETLSELDACTTRVAAGS